MTDPRKAKTLGEAAMNPDGTYNGLRALSWLSDVLTGGKGLPVEEVAKIADDVRARKARGAGWRADCPQCVGSKFTCDAHFTASGTEARRVETGTGSIHDGPAPKGDAQP